MEISSDDFDVENLRGRRSDRRWNRLSVGDLFERVTWATPDKTALIGWPGAFADPSFAKLTYLQADQAANQVAHALVGEGLAPGDRVLMYCANSVEALITMVGVAKAGLVLVPVNPLLAADALRWAIDHVEARYVVADASLAERAADTLHAAGLAVGVVIDVEADCSLPEVPRFHDWIREQPISEVSVIVHADDIWALMFTSGTTAMPKASMTSHLYSYLSGYSYALSYTRGLQYESELVIGTFLPITYHCGHNATLLPAILSGGTLVIGRQPTASDVAEAVTLEKITALWAGSPIWVEQLVEVAERRGPAIDLSSMTVVLYAWGAMRTDLISRLHDAAGQQVKMVEVFGQTESMSCFRFWPDGYPERALQSLEGVNHVGLPTPILAADIHDDAGTSLVGQVEVPGEAVYRSPVVTQGYYRDLDATMMAFRGGWFHSGDSCEYVGYSDRSQVMVDRLKDIVKSGGENVSSARVEAVLASHPSVAQVAVIGLPDVQWGEAVTAVVVPTADSHLDPEDLVVWARSKLAGYESPKRVVLVAAMPETVGGKIRKHELRRSLSKE